MIESVAELLDIAQDTLFVSFAVFLRVGATMLVLPVFGEQSVPMRVRLLLAFCFTVVVAPASISLFDPFTSKTFPAILFLTEPIIGLGFGIVIRLVFITIQVAGSIAAQSTSLAQIAGGATAEPQPAIGHVLYISCLALAAMLGLHVQIAEGFLLSYRVFPVGVAPSASAFSAWGVSHVSDAFSTAFTLAMPFMIVSLLYNVALGIINRAMPQLMVAFVGAPAITAAGLILLLLTAPLLLPIWQKGLESVLANPFRGW